MTDATAVKLDLRVNREFGEGTLAVIQAFCNGDLLGEYKLHLLDNQFLKERKRGFLTGEIVSYKSGVGVPRSLIQKAIEEIQHQSSLLGIPIDHDVIITSNTRASEVLPHLYEEHGYRYFYETEDDEGTGEQIIHTTGFSRMYEPIIE
tara:strand:- start:11729 stop:12172 length:444 start_codon:yes stop_codon:yes gene_type:complete